jgi:hypothetical protein
VALGIKFDVNPLIPFDAKDAVVANELDKAEVAKDALIEVVANELLIALDELIANDAVPNNEPVNAVEVTEVSPAIVVAVVPKLIAVLPKVIELFARFAFVIPAVPLRLELVNPDIDPPSVIVPVDVIVPPVKVIPETDPAVATEVTPLFTTLVAQEAVPSSDPVNAVEVTEVSPAIVVAVPPRLIAVLPTVILEFAKFAFVMPAVPERFEFVNPEIEPPNVIVPVLVIVPPVNVMPDTDPAVATEVTPLFTTFVAHEAVPNKDPVNAVDVNEVNPVIVVAVAPNDIGVDPTVTELFAKFAFVIPAVPLKLALVNPEIEPPSVNDPEEVTVPVNVIPDTVP